ncbi:MAG: ABC transporter ATP-binding protein [Lachnospiraceae bacterium]|nr:ABC transporter ATP-binding protein [Lachnospiraceae bacterium]
MLRIEHLSCGYGGPPIIKDISFHVKEGEKLCILGPNGCGKTTLLRALAGLLPSSGSMELMGSNLRTLPIRQRAQKMALMSQFSPATFDYTVYEAVMLGRYAHQASGLLSGESAADRRAVEESLRLTGTWFLREHLVTRLSGGQLQRVFLARTFAQEPKAILLDEPTNHLDLRYQVELIESLKAWSAAGGRCVVGVFHDMNLALSFADTVLLLDHGQIQSLSSIDDFDLSLLDQLYHMDVRGHMLASLQRWV